MVNNSIKFKIFFSFRKAIIFEIEYSINNTNFITYLRKKLKYILYTKLAILAYVVLYLIAAIVIPKIPVNTNPIKGGDVVIYIKTNGVHTDLVVPVKNEQIDWSKEIKFSNTVAKDTAMRYLAMGWGDKGFYLETPTWADLKFSVAFKAAFALSTTAIHATFYKEMKEGETCKKIVLTKEKYNDLINYISNSLQHDSAGHVINIVTKANYGNNDAFYEANGSYSMFHTCNTCANNGLKKSWTKSLLVDAVG